MRAATVAIVLSHYNHGDYLRESLGAICGQTRPADEIIVVDDGSTDDSVAIIEEFAARHARITFLRNDRNVGLHKSIARTLPLVTAEYLVWAASDDRLLPRFLEKSMPPLERHPESGLCFSELSVLQGDTDEVVRFAVTRGIEHIFDLRDLPEYMTPAAIRRRMKRAYLPMTSNSVVIRRKALLAIGGYPSELEWYSDSFAYTVIALRLGACVVPETLALIRANPGSYSDRGMRDPVRQAAVIGSMLDLLAQPRYRDIRREFRRCPSNFSPCNTLALEVQLRRTRDWDLFLTYLIWKLREYKRGHQLTVARTCGELGIRLVRSILTRLLSTRTGRRVRGALRSVPAWLRRMDAR
jgi:glycosyltransferase involved in cell wall biosynthesis